MEAPLPEQIEKYPKINILCHDPTLLNTGNIKQLWLKLLE